MSNRGKPLRKRADGIPSKPIKQLISLEEAKQLTARYRRSAPASEHGGFFYGEFIRELMAQPGVTGLRFYHGLDKRGNYRLILVGVNDQGTDVIRVRVPKGGGTKRSAARAVKRSAAMAGGESDAIIVDSHLPCPPFCWPASPF
jgi:hypothetical protein